MFKNFKERAKNWLAEAIVIGFYVAIISIPLYITWNGAIINMIQGLQEASYFKIVGLSLFVTSIADIFYVIFKANYEWGKKQ